MSDVIKNFRKPKKYDYNMVAIGAGSAGLVSSYIAAAVKAKVALIEKHRMGGDCLNTGCVPSKALIKSARVMHQARNAQHYGFDKADIEFDFAKVMERVQEVIKKIEPHDSVERYSSLGVECIQGEAKILSPWEVQVNGKTLTTKNIVVATGAHAFTPPIPGLDQMNAMTSDTLWDMRTQPKRLLILGGGPIGSELAQAFHRLGSEVIQVERSPRILVREDPDVSQVVMNSFQQDGIRVLTEHDAKSFRKEGDRKILTADHKGENVEIEFDQVIVALGRRANVKGFGLEDLGVKISKRGTIAHDQFLRTNYKNIFVCGDVAGPYQFTHTAAHMAWFAAVNSLFGFAKKFKVDYSVVPWCTFTDPEVARVGINETEARQKGIQHDVTVYGIDDLDRAIADGEDRGFVKVITAKGSDKILGCTIVGDHAGDIITEYVSAMKHGFGMNGILGTIHIYPTLGESNKYAAGNWKKATAPVDKLRWLELFHAWRRGEVGIFTLIAKLPLLLSGKKAGPQALESH